MPYEHVHYLSSALQLSARGACCGQHLFHTKLVQLRVQRLPLLRGLQSFPQLLLERLVFIRLSTPFFWCYLRHNPCRSRCAGSCQAVLHQRSISLSCWVLRGTPLQWAHSQDVTPAAPTPEYISCTARFNWAPNQRAPDNQHTIPHQAVLPSTKSLTRVVRQLLLYVCQFHYLLVQLCSVGRAYSCSEMRGSGSTATCSHGCHL